VPQTCQVLQITVCISEVVKIHNKLGNGHFNKKEGITELAETLDYSYPCFITIPNADLNYEIPSSKLIELSKYLETGKVNYTIISKGSYIAKSEIPFFLFR